MDKRGLVGYEGLVILSSTAFPRPVQIVRQTIPLCETQRKAGQRRISNMPIGITNPISWLSRFGRYVDIRFEGLL